MKKQDEGFTLIELLIVIVILGILAAVVVFAVGGITDRGQESSCKADKKTLEVAVEAYRAQYSGYPPSGTGEATLSSLGYLRSTSALYNLGSTAGSVVTAGAPCTA
jgi:type II secretion system protein G